MFKLSNIFGNLFERKGINTDKNKYFMVISIIMFFHLMLVFTFRHLGVTQMTWFNVGSVILYLICLVLLELKKHLFVYFITFMEVVLHSVMATLFVGWKFGFALYIIGLVPAGFYVTYKKNNIKSTMIYSVIAGMVEFVVYISCYYISSNFKPIYDVGTKAEISFVFAINAAATFLMVIVFTVLFTLKIQTYQNMLIKKNRLLDNIANTDPLTGLHNRRSISRIFRDMIRAQIPFCVIMCDIDDFKKLNDTYGHEFGDKVLKKVSDVMKNSVRETDYICRWGGEEILILVQSDNISDTVDIAQRIHSDINNIEMYSGEDKVCCTITMGIAQYNKNDDVYTTIDLADKKLYEGKLSGKNTFKF